MVVDRILVGHGAGSLYDLDRTDIETLLPFFFGLVDPQAGERRADAENELVFSDQAEWL